MFSVIEESATVVAAEGNPKSVDDPSPGNTYHDEGEGGKYLYLRGPAGGYVRVALPADEIEAMSSLLAEPQAIKRKG